MAELRFWPALLAYGEATVALVGETRRPGALGRAAIWGVRAGWIAQTALLIAQASSAEGFPFSTWPGALNLLAWLVVSAYLIWGCRPRFRLLGLGVVPVALALLVLARLGGGVGAGEGDHPTVLLALHVGAILTAFAGFTLAAGLGALYLWSERRLKRREPGVLRVRVPPLESLERLGARVVGVSAGALTLGIGLGLASLGDSSVVDAAMTSTIVVWLAAVAFLALRARGLLGGRAAAAATVTALPLVIVVLSVTHFAP